MPKVIPLCSFDESESMMLYSAGVRTPSELRLENLLLKNCLALLCRDSPSKDRDLNRRLRKLRPSEERETITTDRPFEKRRREGILCF